MATKQSNQSSDASSAAGGNTEKSSPANQSPNTQTSPTEAVTDTAKSVISQAKDTAGQAYGLAAEKASSKIDEQKTNLSGSLSGIADGLRTVGVSLRDSGKQNPIVDSAVKYGDQLAQRVESISGYLERSDLRQILRDTERFAKRNPSVFFAGALAAGFLAARFLKSSNPNQALMLRPHSNGEGTESRSQGASQNSAARDTTTGGENSTQT